MSWQFLVTWDDLGQWVVVIWDDLGWWVNLGQFGTAGYRMGWSGMVDYGHL